MVREACLPAPYYIRGNIIVHFFDMTIAGLRIRFQLMDPHTRLYLIKNGRISGNAAISEISEHCDIIVPPVDPDRLEEEKERLGGDIAFAEYSLLIEPLSNLLLKHGRFLFHGAAFLWHERAFLFTGQSGVGKSTQLRHWLAEYPEEVTVINGDKPIIQQTSQGFIVHPSPWTGKENWGGRSNAPLGGLIILKQGLEDDIRRLSAKEAVYPVFLQFLYRPVDKESLELVCRYEQVMLDRIPVWELTNTGTVSSARLTGQTLIEEGF